MRINPVLIVDGVYFSILRGGSYRTFKIDCHTTNRLYSFPSYMRDVYAISIRVILKKVRK